MTCRWADRLLGVGGVGVAAHGLGVQAQSSGDDADNKVCSGLVHWQDGGHDDHQKGSCRVEGLAASVPIFLVGIERETTSRPSRACLRRPLLKSGALSVRRSIYGQERSGRPWCGGGPSSMSQTGACGTTATAAVPNGRAAAIPGRPASTSNLSCARCPDGGHVSSEILFGLLTSSTEGSSASRLLSEASGVGFGSHAGRDGRWCAGRRRRATWRASARRPP